MVQKRVLISLQWEKVSNTQTNRVLQNNNRAGKNYANYLTIVLMKICNISFCR